MNQSELKELAEAIDKTKDFFKRRTHANDWSRNIEQGSSGLKTKQQWGRYYNWLANPQHFDINEHIDYMDCDEYNPPPYEDGMEIEEFQNGPDLLIRVTNMNLEEEKFESQDDEKVSS